ncbi:MAG: hypothetical protein KKA63_06195, partial [Gammaproteobacteria bacterium]|nr:hypothetical protein [Gammaproteobacteria bacterium]
VVSHDLQEPLHLIRAFTERITTKSRSVLDEQGALYLQRIETEDIAHRMVEIGLLASQHITTLLRGEPFTQTFRDYFRIRHRTR